MSLLRTRATQVVLTENSFSLCLHENRHKNGTESSRVAVTFLSFTALGLLQVCINFETVLKINSADAFYVTAKSNLEIHCSLVKFVVVK